MAVVVGELVVSMARQALLERVGARLRSGERGWNRVESEVIPREHVDYVHGKPTLVPTPSEQIRARTKVVHPVGEKPSPERGQQIDKYLATKLSGGWFWHRYYAWRYSISLESVEVMNHLQSGLQRLHDWGVTDSEASLTPGIKAFIDVLQSGETVARLTYYFKPETPYSVFQKYLRMTQGAFAEEGYAPGWMKNLESAYKQVTRWLKALRIKQPIWVHKEAKADGQQEYHIRVGKGPEVTVSELKAAQKSRRIKALHLDVNTYTSAWNYRCMQVMKEGLHEIAKNDVERGKRIVKEAGDLMLGRMGETLKRNAVVQRIMAATQPRSQDNEILYMLTTGQRTNGWITVQNGVEDWGFNLGDYYDLCRQQDRQALNALYALLRMDVKSDDFEEKLVQIHKLWRSSREAYDYMIKHCSYRFDRSEEWTKIQEVFVNLLNMLEDNGRGPWAQVLAKQGVGLEQAESLVGLTRAVMSHRTGNTQKTEAAYDAKSENYGRLAVKIEAHLEMKGSLESQLAVDAYVRRLQDLLGPENRMKDGRSTLVSNQEYILFAREDYQYEGPEKAIIPKEVVRFRHKLGTPAEKARMMRLLTQGESSGLRASDLSQPTDTGAGVQVQAYGANGHRYWHSGDKKDIPMERRRYPKRAVNLYGIFGVELGDFERMKTKWKKEICLKEHPDKAPRINLELIECPEVVKHVYDDITDKVLAKELQRTLETAWLEREKGYAIIENEYQEALTTLCFRHLKEEYDWLLDQGPECYVDMDEDTAETLQGAIDYLNRSYDDMGTIVKQVHTMTELDKIIDIHHQKIMTYIDSANVKYREVNDCLDAKLQAALKVRTALISEQIARLREENAQLESEVMKIREEKTASENERYTKMNQLVSGGSQEKKKLSDLLGELSKIQDEKMSVVTKITQASNTRTIASQANQTMTVEQLRESSLKLIAKIFSQLRNVKNSNQRQVRHLSTVAYVPAGESPSSSLASTPASSVDLLLPASRPSSNGMNGVDHKTF